MPTYLTEYTKTLGPDDEDYRRHGVIAQKWAGPFIYAANLEEAKYICGFLFADPAGEQPLTVLGAVEEIIPMTIDLEEMLRRRVALEVEVARLIRETPRR